MKKIANVAKLSREEWLEMRTKGIGGSDAAAACGLNPWKSKASLYLEKTGQVVKDFDNEVMRQGRLILIGKWSGRMPSLSVRLLALMPKISGRMGIFLSITSYSATTT